WQRTLMVFAVFHEVIRGQHQPVRADEKAGALIDVGAQPGRRLGDSRSRAGGQGHGEQEQENAAAKQGGQRTHESLLEQRSIQLPPVCPARATGEVTGPPREIEGWRIGSVTVPVTDRRQAGPPDCPSRANTRGGSALCPRSTTSPRSPDSLPASSPPSPSPTVRSPSSRFSPPTSTTPTGSHWRKRATGSASPR